MRYHPLIGLALMLAGATACETKAPTETPPVDPGALPSGSVRAFVVHEPGGSADRITLTIHVEGKDFPMAAYQGRLTFGAGALEILDASVPSDGARIVNAAAGPGVVKFAGFSTGTFSATAAVRLVVKPLMPLESAHLLATLDVVGESTGKPVSKSRIVLAPALYDAAPAR